ASVRCSPFMDVLACDRRETDDSVSRPRIVSGHHGIGIVGRGATPQTADAQGGSGGVGMRNSFPCVDAEPPVMHWPVNVLRFGNGLVKPSVRVCRKATIWFSS